MKIQMFNETYSLYPILLFGATVALCAFTYKSIKNHTKSPEDIYADNLKQFEEDQKINPNNYEKVPAD